MLSRKCWTKFRVIGTLRVFTDLLTAPIERLEKNLPQKQLGCEKNQHALVNTNMCIQFHALRGHRMLLPGKLI